MNLCKAVRSALVLLTALGVAALLPTAASSAPTSGTSVHATTAPWSFIRRACKTVTAGTICVNFEGNAQPSTYRVVYQLQPKPGQWMRPLSTAVWFNDVFFNDSGVDGAGAQGNYAEARYRPFCSATCPAVRTPTNYVVASKYYAVYTMIADTPSGHVDVSAGVTPAWTQSNLGGCASVDAESRFFLTSTSDGTVYAARSGNTGAYGGTFYLDDHTSKGAHRFFTTDPGTHYYASPTFYAGWQRFPLNDGSWATQQVIAGNAYTTSNYFGPSC